MRNWSARTPLWRLRVAAAVFSTFLPSAVWAQEPESPAPQSAAPQTDSGAFQGISTLPLPPVTFSAFADIAAGYSTGTGGGGGHNNDDAFMRGRIGGDVHYDKPRLQVDGSYSLTGEYWSKFHSLNHLSNHLAVSSRLTAIPEMLFINANAFATPAELTRAGDISASGEPVSRYNSRDTYGYVVEPQFMLRFDDFATSTTTASHGGVFFVQPSTGNTGTPLPITPAQNAFSTTLSEELASGSNFERLHWSLIGSYGQFSQTTQTERQWEGLGNVGYAVTYALRLFVIGGYSEFKSTVPLTKDLNGPTALGGLTYTLGPDWVFNIEAGTQHNFPTYMGSARWQITPRTVFTAEATDEITTPQGDILSRLGNLNALGDGFGGYGGFGTTGGIGSGLGLGNFGGFSTFGPGGLALDNSIYRIRTINGSFSHYEDLTRYTLSIFGSERDRLDSLPSPFRARTSVYGIRGSVTRPLMPDLFGMLSVGYSRGNEFGGRDNIVSTDAQLTYRLSQHIDLYLTNHLAHRDSANQFGFSNVPVTEDQVLIGIRARL